jgi:MYXO-CTERM domain-containing protein
MTRTITGTVLALVLLAACPAEDDPTAPTDTGTTTTPTPTPTTPTATTPFSDFPEADLTDPAVIVGLASASAPQLFALHYGILAEADANTNPICPTVAVSKKSTTYAGGCTDANGAEWFGSAVIAEDKTAITVTFTGFGSTGMVPCTKTGEVVNARLLDGTFALAPDLSTLTYITAGTFTAIDADLCTAETRNFLLDYSGVTRTSLGLWSGAGTYADDVYGRAAVETVDALFDDTECATESLSGVTTFVTSTDDAAVLYDGAFDCDPESTAIWLLNGASQGELAGVGCSSTSTQGAGLLGVAALIALGRRRRQA